MMNGKMFLFYLSLVLLHICQTNQNILGIVLILGDSLSCHDSIY